jgi:hypothetical protein
MISDVPASSLVNKPAFVGQLRKTAEILKPFINPPSPGAKHWNGTGYVEGDPGQFEPQALAWWSTLTAIAEMIDHQGAPLNEKQTSYLDGLLFGGMGSLNDLSISSKPIGKSAESVDKQLDRQRQLLFASFQAR